MRVWGEKKELSCTVEKYIVGKYILWESILIHMLWEILWSFLKKFKKRKYLTIQQFHYQVLSKADELILSKGYLHSHVHCTHTHTHTHTHTQILFASCEHRMNLLDIMLSEK